MVDHNKRFLKENEVYREKRNLLLEEEIKLRDQMEKVAELRRSLPAGTKIEKDYVFQSFSKETKLSELFIKSKASLIVYNFMFSKNMKKACPACTSLIDGFNTFYKQVSQRINMAVVAKNSIKAITEYAQNRSWNDIPLLSSENNTFNLDFFGEEASGEQNPIMHVFFQKEGEIFHHWSSELLFAPTKGHPRHLDIVWPLWGLLDFTPEGRGDFFPNI